MTRLINYLKTHQITPHLNLLLSPYLFDPYLLILLANNLHPLLNRYLALFPLSLAHPLLNHLLLIRPWMMLRSHKTLLHDLNSINIPMNYKLKLLFLLVGNFESIDLILGEN